MRWKKTFQVVDVDCEGEIDKVITRTTLDLPGKTMLDKLVYINTVNDSLRRLIGFEPHGCVQQSVNLLIPPTQPDCDAGFMIVQSDRAHPISGPNTVRETTARLEIGMLEMTEPETLASFDTATATAVSTAL
jgi:proline racemase